MVHVDATLTLRGLKQINDGKSNDVLNISESLGMVHPGLFEKGRLIDRSGVVYSLRSVSSFLRGC